MDSETFNKVIDASEEYKPIPGFLGYYINKDGIVYQEKYRGSKVYLKCVGIYCTEKGPRTSRIIINGIEYKIKDLFKLVFPRKRFLFY